MATQTVDHERRQLLLAGAGLLFPVRLVQSLRLLRCGPERHKAGAVHDLAGFETRDWFKPFGKTRVVYVYGPATAPPVLVLHELPGLTRYDVDFAYRLAERGFRVYLPLLFGKEYDNAFQRHFWGECVVGKWPWDAKKSLNPWVAPLSALCDRVFEETKRPIGVVGMCLTGILPISLLANPHVVAPVLAQPTLPFPFDGGRKQALGLTDEEIARAKQRFEEEKLTALAFRVTTDCFCPHERFVTLGKTFGSPITLHEIPYPPARHGHSVLAAEYHHPDPPPGVREAFEQTVAFLQNALRA